MSIRANLDCLIVQGPLAGFSSQWLLTVTRRRTSMAKAWSASTGDPGPAQAEARLTS